MFGEVVEIVTGIMTLPASDADSVAVTVTLDPSATGFGDADSRTAGRVCAVRRVTVTV